MRVEFTVPGRPVPKGRPRFNTHTGTTYTPAKTREAENAFATYALKYRGSFPEGPVSVSCVFYVKGRQADGDNLLKLCTDAMQVAGVYANDKQIRRWHGEIHPVDSVMDERTEVVVEAYE